MSDLEKSVCCAKIRQGPVNMLSFLENPFTHRKQLKNHRLRGHHMYLTERWEFGKLDRWSHSGTEGFRSGFSVPPPTKTKGSSRFAGLTFFRRGRGQVKGWGGCATQFSVPPCSFPQTFVPLLCSSTSNCVNVSLLICSEEQLGHWWAGRRPHANAC